MRRSEAAVAVIRRINEGATLWLAQWNPKWERFHFVSGHRRPEETFRECLVRELGEELGLREGEGYTVSTLPPVPVAFSAWSVSAGADTSYAMELFDVELTPAAEARTSADPANRWLSEAEIRDGRAGDGRPISATMVRLLDEHRLRRGGEAR
jgi:8-oxo-dGTP pyrophosphatase MutT (NUDIX family)